MEEWPSDPRVASNGNQGVFPFQIANQIANQIAKALTWYGDRRIIFRTGRVEIGNSG
jgi:hypothetical protein